MSDCFNRMCGVWSRNQTGKELCCMGCKHTMSIHTSQGYSMRVLEQLTSIAESLSKIANPMMSLNTETGAVDTIK